jgi:hypothetical protein
MGNLCSKGAQSTEASAPVLIPQEKDIKITTYSSEADKYYECQEKKFNYLTKIKFKDYLYSLVNFSNDNATLDDDYSKANLDMSANDAFFNEQFSFDTFQSFIENKILKYKTIYDEALNKERITSIFKTILLQGHRGLGQKLAMDANKKGIENADQSSIITKGYAISFGILFCSGPNYVKIRAIFNLFQEEGNLKSNEKFSQFILALFILASYGMLHVRNQLNDFDEVGAVGRAIVKKLVDTSELKDSQHLVEVTNKLIFGEDLSQSLDYDSFKAKFADENKDTSIAFMLTPSGIRFMQYKHNV